VRAWMILWMLWEAVAIAAPPSVSPVPTGKSPAGEVSTTDAVFRVPVQPREAWGWNLGMPGVLEFGWLVELTTPTGQYRLGVQVWHVEGSMPAEGTLAELIGSGETGVWRMPEAHGAPLAEMPVSVEVQGDDLVIKVSEPSTLQTLFLARPGTFRLITHRGHGPSPDQRLRREQAQTVTLVYRD